MLGIFAWALLNFGNVYYGLACRVRDLIVEMVKSKGSLGMTRSMAYHPEVQHGIAEITMELEESIRALLESVAVDWSNGVDHGGNWPIKLVAAKHKAVTGAWRGRRQGDGPVRRFRHVQEDTSSSACSATREPDASTRPTPPSRTNSSAS